MRIKTVKTLLTTVFITMMLVIGIDYGAMALNGKSLILGRANYANGPTSISRTGQGAALTVYSEPGRPPIRVNRTVKAPKLNADLVDGLHGSQLARHGKMSHFRAPGCQTLTNVPWLTYQKIADLGTFTKVHKDSLIRLDFQTVLEFGQGTATGVIFELRVDDYRRGPAVNLRDHGPENATFSGYIDGLSAGSHTVSLWARAGGQGTAAYARYDAGCFGGGLSANLNHVWVHETS